MATTDSEEPAGAETPSKPLWDQKRRLPKRSFLELQSWPSWGLAIVLAVAFVVQMWVEIDEIANVDNLTISRPRTIKIRPSEAK